MSSLATTTLGYIECLGSQVILDKISYEICVLLLQSGIRIVQPYNDYTWPTTKINVLHLKCFCKEIKDKKRSVWDAVTKGGQIESYTHNNGTISIHIYVVNAYSRVIS